MGAIKMWAAADDAAVKGGFASSGADAVLKDIDAAELNASLKSLAGDIDEMLRDVETKGGFKLKEIDVGLEITAEAGIRLIGSMKVGGKAAIKLTFKKD
jgi:hypothetical protein